MTTKNIEWLIGRLRAFSGTRLAPALMHQAADTLQSQAESVKALELDLDVRAGSIEAVQAVNMRQAERIKELEGRLVALEADYAETRDELQEANDSLASTYHILGERDAQLAEIAESEPVIWAISYDGVTPYTLWHEGDGALLDLEVKRQGGTTQKMPLYTRPMPVQSAEHCLWARNGHEPCQHVKLAQDVTELVELLEFMWREVSMNEYAFEKLETALSKYKGAK